MMTTWLTAFTEIELHIADSALFIPCAKSNSADKKKK
jgi:hypothetical protein